MKRLSFIFIIVLLLPTYQIASANSGSAVTDPAQNLRRTLAKIDAFNQYHHYQKYTNLRTFIQHEVMPCFSFTALAQRVIGPYARHMTTSKIVAFRSLLRKDFQTMLIQHLGDFSPESNPVEIEKTRYILPKLANVTAKISLNKGVPLLLHFRMQLVHQRWKIANVQSTGLSLVMYYRTRFHGLLQAYSQATH